MPSRGRECLLEQHDLTRVIQVVLRRAGELGVRRVLGAQLLQQAFHREGAHGTLQLLIQSLQGLLAFAPSLRTARRHWRPLFFRRELRTLATKPPKDQSVSAGQVKDDLPNAVRSGYWVSCGVFRRDTRQHLEYRGPMPGLAPEGPADLICEDLHIQGHRLSHASRSAELVMVLELVDQSTSHPGSPQGKTSVPHASLP